MAAVDLTARGAVERRHREARAWLKANAAKLRYVRHWTNVQPEWWNESIEQEILELERPAKPSEFSGEMFPGADYYVHVERERLTSRLHEGSKYEYHSIRAARYGGVNDFDREDWARIKEYFGQRCAYCEARARLQIEHVVPMSDGGDNAPWNIVPACRRCNVSKRARSLSEWCLKKGKCLRTISDRIAAARTLLRQDFGRRYDEPGMAGEGQAA